MPTTKKTTAPKAEPAVGTQFELPLVLTTPHMRGIDVRDCQWLLSGNNEVLLPPNKETLRTYTGRIDKEYGPTTAGAVKEAKWELGYPVVAIDNQFGQEIYEYLIGRRELSAAYLQRQKDRLLKAPKIKVLEFAITQIGNKESPFGSNRQKYGEWYGWNGVAWCDIFVSYCISHATGILWKEAYVPHTVFLARMGQNYLSITHNPEPGDLVSYGDDDHHIEFFEHDNGDNTFSAVGGNTGPTNFSNGGMVLRQDRSYSLVHEFMRLSLPTPKEL